MDNDHPDRMAAARKRGPPIGPQLTPPPEPAEIVEIPQPSKSGLRCRSCGVTMIPRRDRVESAAKCYATCSRCPQRMVLTFDKGRISTVRWLSR